jgi:hypothetical protein
MANGLITADGVYREGKAAFLTVDGIYRKVTAGFRTVGGVYEQVWSSGVRWNKYECTRISKKTYEDSAVNIGETDGHSTIGVAGTNLYKNYWWGTEETGYVVRNPVTVTRDNPSEGQWKYWDGSTTHNGTMHQAIYQVSSVDPDTYEYVSKIVATAKSTTSYSYDKGDLVGTVEAPEGEYPEALTYVTGNSSRTIMKDGNTYYWYELA